MPVPPWCDWEQQPAKYNDAYVVYVGTDVSSLWAVALNKWLNIQRRLG